MTEENFLIGFVSTDSETIKFGKEVLTESWK